MTIELSELGKFLKDQKAAVDTEEANANDPNHDSNFYLSSIPVSNRRAGYRIAIEQVAKKFGIKLDSSEK